jgi:hypothetical protein
VEDDLDIISEERNALVRKIGELQKENEELRANSRKRLEFFQLIQFQTLCVNREWLEKTVNGKICKREMHEFRKVLYVMADEERKDRKDFLKNGRIMNALLLNAPELDMKWMKLMGVNLPKMDVKTVNMMLMISKIASEVWKHVGSPDMKFVTSRKIKNIMADAMFHIILELRESLSSRRVSLRGNEK